MRTRRSKQKSGPSGFAWMTSRRHGCGLTPQHPKGTGAGSRSRLPSGVRSNRPRICRSASRGVPGDLGERATATSLHPMDELRDRAAPRARQTRRGAKRRCRAPCRLVARNAGNLLSGLVGARGDHDRDAQHPPQARSSAAHLDVAGACRRRHCGGHRLHGCSAHRGHHVQW
jgi:hypothetical protein